MKVVLAPDKFAGTLTAAEVAEALARGWASERPDDELVLAPMADGGEGTLEVVEAAVAGSERMTVEVADARGRAIEAAWLRLPDGRAMVEAAQAVGLSQLAPADRNPRLTTSFGVGQLLAAAVQAGCTEIVCGLGGSATNDCGSGMAVALGHRLLRADGNGIKVGGEFLRDLVRVELGPALGADVVVACDVTNPLLGAEGAVRVFGPQKGAAEADFDVLEEALATMADVAERDLVGGPWRDLEGAGAAGGLGFALAAFCGADLTGGSKAVGDLVGLEPALEGAQVAITGEGKLDRQTEYGKTPGYVLERARAHGVSVYAVAGSFEHDAERAFDATEDLGPEGMERAAELVAERAAALARR